MIARKYPVGIQTFSEIRTKGYVYVDKTAYVYKLANANAKYNFLSRPRRFGKSLLTSTLHSYFEGRRDLFKGLLVEKLEKNWTEYPVLHFDFSLAKHLDSERLNRFLNNILKENEDIFGIINEEKDANLRLANLIKGIYKKTGKQVVVLIDEYDAPLLDVVHEDSSFEQLRYLLRNFFSPLKACDPYLRFVFLTGITKFSQLSIFSELNNISNISMLEEYAGICGITEEELLTQMSEDIGILARKKATTKEIMLKMLKENYDGYHFCWPSPDIFNPYSLLNAFDRKNIGNYWFESGTPTYLIEMMNKFRQLPSKIGGNIVKESAFDAPTQNLRSITPLLYQAGYVTIKDFDPLTELYTLDIPNREIFVGLYESLLPNYLEEMTDEGNATIARISVFIRQGDMNAALQLLQQFLATVPYCDNTLYEGHYQQMLYVIFALLTAYHINVEQRTSIGRTDMVIETNDHIYVMEIKFNHPASEALAQINKNHYADAFTLKNKTITKVGIAFNVERERNFTEWTIE